MYCKKCGRLVPDGMNYCGFCGEPVERSANGSGESTIPIDPSFWTQRPLPMNWYRFLVIFLLFGVFMNILDACSIFFNFHYIYEQENLTLLTYAQYPALRTLDIVYAISLLFLSAFGAWTWYSLWKYKRLAPLLTVLLYLLDIPFILFYAIFFAVITKTAFDFTIIFTVATQILLAVANHVYFKKREHLFNR